MPECIDMYESDASEADMKIRRHATAVQASNKILIYSPDTDVYNIGLLMLHYHPSRQVAVQINLLQNQNRFLILTS